MLTITFIITRTSPRGKAWMRPACELYRSIAAAQEAVMFREYSQGIPTFMHAVPAFNGALDVVRPIGEVY